MKTISRKRFPKGCSINQVTIRETNGADEDTAIMLAEQRGSSSFLQDELIKLSITHVDGKKLEPGVPLNFKKWNTKTRGLVASLFAKLNGSGNQEVMDFLADEEETASSKPA